MAALEKVIKHLMIEPEDWPAEAVSWLQVPRTGEI
jgi:hypothetical protein